MVPTEPLLMVPTEPSHTETLQHWKCWRNLHEVSISLFMKAKYINLTIWYSNLEGGGQDDLFVTINHCTYYWSVYMLYPFSNLFSNFLIISDVNSTIVALVCVCSVPFGFGSLSRITFGLNGYTPVARNPNSMLPMVMLLHHASEKSDEN